MVSGRAFEVQASGTSSRARPPPHPRCAAVATLPSLSKFPKACCHFAPHILVAQQAPFGLNFLGHKGAFSPKAKLQRNPAAGGWEPRPAPQLPSSPPF